MILFSRHIVSIYPDSFAVSNIDCKISITSGLIVFLDQGHGFTCPGAYRNLLLITPFDWQGEKTVCHCLRSSRARPIYRKSGKSECVNFLDSADRSKADPTQDTSITSRFIFRDGVSGSTFMWTAILSSISWLPYLLGDWGFLRI